jgi:RHS repeat-associated protein
MKGAQKVHSQFCADGQMPTQEYEVISNDPSSLHQNPSPSIGRGAGVRRNPPATINETSYPLYDAHGNMTAQLLKNGASFTVANEKSYDAWGGIRAGNSNPEYKGRYCANLGHTQDDESNLIYMRARYYEQSSGRFVNEDPEAYGANWFVYADNTPCDKGDYNGRFSFDLGGGYWIRFDSPYSKEGTGNQIRDLTWGKTVGGQKQQMGSIRPDGTTKHGAGFSDKVKDLIRNHSQAAKKAAKQGGYGLGLYLSVIGLNSVDAYFLYDPMDLGETIDIVGTDWELFQGNITIHAT